MKEDTENVVSQLKDIKYILSQIADSLQMIAASQASMCINQSDDAMEAYMTAKRKWPKFVDSIESRTNTNYRFCKSDYLSFMAPFVSGHIDVLSMFFDERLKDNEFFLSDDYDPDSEPFYYMDA